VHGRPGSAADAEDAAGGDTRRRAGARRRGPRFGARRRRRDRLDHRHAAVLATLVVSIIASLRRGQFGLDIVAALAMAGALAVGENLAAAVVALMYAGGQALESYADGRAKREMTALLARAPRTAVRHRGAELETVDIEVIRPGDRLMIRRGDVLPVDGTIAGGRALIDTAAVTGESLPRHLADGAAVMSGTTNVGDVFTLLATRPASESTYAGIVRLVRDAIEGRAPMARLADRFALGFLAATVILALAAWLISGDPVRAVAVLVVATPCPLILAVPVAIVAGLSRAAGRGVLVKGGGALEALARVRVMVLDKTGTLTHGEARLADIEVFEGFDPDEVLRLAASLDQASPHVVARALIAAATERGLALATPEAATEAPGEGVDGIVEGRRVRVGGRAYVLSALADGQTAPMRPLPAGVGVVVSVAVDGRLAGRILLADGIRDGTEALLARLRGLGMRRIVLATGDRADIAEAVAGGVGIDDGSGRTDARAEGRGRPRRPASGRAGDDGRRRRQRRARAGAAADVGVAMGARGAAASAEAADAVLFVGQPRPRLCRRHRHRAARAPASRCRASMPASACPSPAWWRQRSATCRRCTARCCRRRSTSR
jgi:heavy metal translocating P-type ATPase